MPASAHDLTGVWDGLYSYADGRSVTFVATLIEHGSAFTGATHEPCAHGRVRTLYATLAGSRQGSTIVFRKSYDSAVPGYHVVDYSGTLNADATEIEGRWTIAGAWSGKFMMIRPSRTAASAERAAKARAD